MRAVLTILSLCLFHSLALASSVIRNPLRSLTTLRNATIHTQNHRVTALSEFTLSFVLPHEEVKFVLEPNHDILPQHGATVRYLGPDGEVVRTEAIERLEHKVFKGNAWIRGKEEDKWMQAGWTRVTVRKDGLNPLFEGAFSVGRDNHHIQMGENFARTRHTQDPEIEAGDDEIMVLWRDSDILTEQELEYHGHGELRRDLEYGNGLSCRADTLGFNMQSDHPVYTAMTKRSDMYWGSMSLPSLFGKRQIDSSTGGNSAGVNLVSTIGQTNGCPATRKVALVGVATDCTYTAQFNSTESARQNIITQMNTASNLYERTFNISLGLQNLTISDPNCPGTPAAATPWNQGCGSADIQQRLNLFSAWRGTQQDSNSHWTLLSTCNTGSAVGLAWLGQACVNTAITTNSSTTGNGQSTGDGSETVSGANVVVRTQGASEWQIIAHETGHTFGAVHDCTSQTCASSTTVSSSQCCPLSSSTCNAGEKYIMNPSTANGITDFSPCSIGNICSALGRNSVKSTCLSDNKGVSTITGQQCGNGIVEAGEDCDCGGTESCGDNACCDPTTCKFKSGAVCDDSNEDCCHQCQFASNGTVCRASTGVCDPAETCTGNSPNCPVDVTAPDGQHCGSGGNLQCASGQCTSRDLQCKTVMGSYTSGNDTYACDSSGCTLSCASPEFGYGVCYGLQQNFLDGTACGGGGHCQNGVCKGANVGGQIRSWIDDHKAIVIGVACAVGALILFSILGCIGRRLKRRRNSYPKPGVAPGRRRRMPPPPPPPQGSWGPGGWQQPEMSGGGGGGGFYGYGAPPPGPPPPAYTPRGVRYA